MSEASYQRNCSCGAIRLTVGGVPAAVRYCRFIASRRWSADPVKALTSWQPQAVNVTQGVDTIASYHRATRSYRTWRKKFGGRIFSEHPGMGLIDVDAEAMPGLPFRPTSARSSRRGGAAHPARASEAEPSAGPNQAVQVGRPKNVSADGGDNLVRFAP